MVFLTEKIKEEKLYIKAKQELHLGRALMNKTELYIKI